MTNGISGSAVKWLTYLVYMMMAMLTFVSTWSKVESSQNAQRLNEMERILPDKYVRLERYTRDVESQRCNFDDIKRLISDVKHSVDRIITRELDRVDKR